MNLVEVHSGTKAALRLSEGLDAHTILRRGAILRKIHNYHHTTAINKFLDENGNYKKCPLCKIRPINRLRCLSYSWTNPEQGPVEVHGILGLCLTCHTFIVTNRETLLPEDQHRKSKCKPKSKLNPRYNTGRRDYGE